MNTRLKSVLLWTVTIATLAGAGLLGVSFWYRASDHSSRLLALRSPLASAGERLLAVKDGYREIAFRLTNEKGRVAKGVLRIPDCPEGPLPALLILGGEDTGAKAAGLIRLEKKGILCAMDYPARPVTKVSLFEIPSQLRSLNAAVLDAVGMTFTVLDYLCSRPGVDSSRVTVVGASFGVPFAVIAAAFEPRVGGLVLVHGAGDLEELIDWNLRKKISAGFLRKSASFILGTLTSPFEPASYIGRTAPRPLLMVNSGLDEKLPVSCVTLLYRNATEPRELFWLDSKHLHPSNRELIDSLTGIVSAWLEKHELL